MPGKQMAIDADLNAGVIDQDGTPAAPGDREEADFYGSMDGASKFVRGDAVAGILILFINIIGGLIIGTAQHDLDLSGRAQLHAADDRRRSRRTDAVAAAVDRGRDHRHPHVALAGYAPAGVPAAVQRSPYAGGDGGRHGTLGLVPGMPNLAFISLAAVAGFGAYRMSRRAGDEDVAETAIEPEEPVTTEIGWQDVDPVDMVGLEVGYRLIPLVDRQRDGAMVARIKGVRKKLTEDLGFLIPAVHIRDNLELAPNAYRISLAGVPVGEGEIQTDKELAINPGQVFGKIAGSETTDPAFGLEAYWIDASQREEAQMLGYTVVDPATVVATHLSQVLKTNAQELLGHEETQQLLERLSSSAPKLVEELTPKTLPVSVIAKVLQNLLAEHVPIRNIRKIAETLAEQGAKSQDPDALSAIVRVALGRSIVQDVAGMRPELPVLTLDPELERILNESTQEGSSPGLEPGLVDKLHESLSETASKQEMVGEPAVLLVAPTLRPWLSRLTRGIRNLHVLAYNEIPDDKRIQMVAAVS